MKIRRQASLYLENAPQIESVRQRFNPIQAALIPAHVTLCREDEVTDWTRFREQLESIVDLELSLGFGAPIREDNLVYLPVNSGTEDFHELRKQLLESEPRAHSPHITLIHPRNGTCTDEIFQEIQSQVDPFKHTFQSVQLIEQLDGYSGIWRQWS